MTTPLLREFTAASAMRGESLLWGTHDVLLITNEAGPLAGMRKLFDRSIRNEIVDAAGVERIASGDIDIDLFMARMAEDATRAKSDEVYQATHERMIPVACFRTQAGDMDAMKYLTTCYKTNFVLHEKYDHIIKSRQHDNFPGYMMAIRYRSMMFSMNKVFISQYLNVNNLF